MAVEGDQLPEARRFSPLAMALFGLIVPEVVEFTVGLGESAGQRRVKVMGMWPVDVQPLRRYRSPVQGSAGSSASRWRMSSIS